jgi:hypothetical protein
MGSAAGRTPGVAARVRAEVSEEPEYGRAGQCGRFVAGTPFSGVEMDALLGGPRPVDDVAFFARTAFAGWYAQDVGGSGPEDLRGRSVFLGVSSGFEHSLHRYDGLPRETAVANLLGPLCQLDWYGGGMHLRGRIELYGDFAAVDSHAVEEYDKTHRLKYAKSSLRSWGYYYASGATARSELRLCLAQFDVGAEARYHYFDSIEGHDRRQHRVQDDFNVVDWDLRQGFFAGWTTPWRRVKLSAAYQHARRWGGIREVRRESGDSAVLLNAGREF